MANITQETREQNIERRCIELARCPRNDKVVFGKQMKGYGMRMPEGLGFCDALDWIAEYLNKVYGPDAIDITVRVRALERSDVGYRSMLIQSEDGEQIEKAELGMNDVFLPNGESASRCPYHVHLRMNTLMAEDFEAFGDSFAESSEQKESESGSEPETDQEQHQVQNPEYHQESGRVDIIDGVASIDPSDNTVRTVLDLSFLGEDSQANGTPLPPTELLIKCPDPHLALDLIDVIEDSLFGEDDEDDTQEDRIPDTGPEAVQAAIRKANGFIQHINDLNSANMFLRLAIEIHDENRTETPQ